LLPFDQGEVFFWLQDCFAGIDWWEEKLPDTVLSGLKRKNCLGKHPAAELQRKSKPKDVQEESSGNAGKR
jgi:hypothetical protein